MKTVKRIKYVREKDADSQKSMGQSHWAKAVSAVYSVHWRAVGSPVTAFAFLSPCIVRPMNHGKIQHFYFGLFLSG